jgi:hypothetical protein
MRAPSGLNAALATSISCPLGTASSRPEEAFHNLAVVSFDAVKTRWPSGLNIAVLTSSL